MTKVFHKYSSIISAYQQKVLNSMSKQGLDQGEWVANEKIHGSNFSFWYDGTIWTGRREGILEEGVNFYGSVRVHKYFPAVESIYKRLVDAGIMENGDTMAIYGELFGGKFFDHKSDVRAVQDSVNYHPDIEFSAFDISVFPLDGDEYILSYLELLEFIDGELPMCPEIKRGTLSELFTLPNDFPSLVPAAFGLVVPEGSHAHCEGFVVRPLDGERMLGETRCIFKSKNDKFKEKAVKEVDPDKYKMSEEDGLVFSEVAQYINTARLESVLSKFGEPTWKKFGQVLELLIVDALEDFYNDTGIILKKTDFWGKGQMHVSNLATEVVRDKFRELEVGTC